MEMNWSYIAGFIDGEGHIVPKKTVPSGRIIIVNTDKRIMDMIAEFLYNNYITFSMCKRNTKEKPHHKDVYQMTISGKNAIRKILDNCNILDIEKLNKLKELVA